MEDVFLGLIVFLGFFVQTVTGFGSNVIILSLGVLFYDFYEILPIALLFNILMGIYFLFIKFYELEFQFIFKKIFFVMGIGFLLGIYLSEFIKNQNLNVNKLLAILIFFLSTYEFIILLVKKENGKPNLILANFLIFLSGTFQAIFATGGPFLVYGLQKINLNKEKFRNSLIIIWLIFNSILLLQNPINSKQLKTSLLIFLSLPLGIYLGERIHDKISIEKFNLTTRAILIISSIIIIIK